MEVINTDITYYHYLSVCSILVGKSILGLISFHFSCLTVESLISCPSEHPLTYTFQDRESSVAMEICFDILSPEIGTSNMFLDYVLHKCV